MPQKRTRKRKKAKKRKTYRKKNYMMLPLGGFKPYQIVKLRYVEEIALDASALAYASYAFSANGIYDPSISGVGHQPANYDIWQSRYEDYLVLGSKITAQITPGGGSVNPALCGIYIAGSATEADAALTAGITSVLEQGARNTSFKRVPGNDALPAKGITLSQYYSPQKVWGLSKNYLHNSANYGGNGSSNPVEEARYTVWANSIAGNNPGRINLVVTIDYIVKFSGLVASQPS